MRVRTTLCWTVRLRAPSGSTYDYVWTARGSTGDTAKLIAGTDGPTPTFEVQDEVDSDETYEYRLTVSAENAEDGFLRRYGDGEEQAFDNGYVPRQSLQRL